MVTATQAPSIVVRRAGHADIPFIAWCNHEATSPMPDFSYWDPLLEGTNTTSMAFIEAVFRADALAWGSPEDFFIIEDNGTPVGGASGFVMDADDYRPLKLDRLAQIGADLGWQPEHVAAFQHGYEAVWSDPHDPTLAPSASWIIECVAVVPAARGKGMAKRLLRAILDAGKQQGHTRAGISVTMGNDAAQGLYEALGFQMYMTYGTDYFDGQFPGTIKYRMRLD
ncbi:MAG: GNAT family N-acetyltransferase [Chloroflexota bacterium]|nr:GNAT family N-acetyltransferase [Chloroflexota bacterium]